MSKYVNIVMEKETFSTKDFDINEYVRAYVNNRSILVKNTMSFIKKDYTIEKRDFYPKNSIYADLLSFLINKIESNKSVYTLEYITNYLYDMFTSLDKLGIEKSIYLKDKMFYIHSLLNKESINNFMVKNLFDDNESLKSIIHILILFITKNNYIINDRNFNVFLTKCKHFSI